MLLALTQRQPPCEQCEQERREGEKVRKKQLPVPLLHYPRTIRWRQWRSKKFSQWVAVVFLTNPSRPRAVRHEHAVRQPSLRPTSYKAELAGILGAAPVRGVRTAVCGDTRTMPDLSPLARRVDCHLMVSGETARLYHRLSAFEPKREGSAG